MARDYFINGESLVRVKNAAIGSLSELGLAADPITVSLNFRHQDIQVNAWGGLVGPEIQYMLMDATISMTLVHLDRDVLDTCLKESMAGGGSSIGQVPRAGARMGGGVALGQASNRFISLNIASPVSSKPWRFPGSYITGLPFTFTLGNERSLVTLSWRAIPYQADPWGGGTGARNVIVWDYTADT